MNDRDKIDKKIQRKLSNDEIVTVFCFDQYPRIYDRFKYGCVYLQKIALLINDCKQNKKFAQLLNQLGVEVTQDAMRDAKVEVDYNGSSVSYRDGHLELELKIKLILIDIVVD